MPTTQFDPDPVLEESRRLQQQRLAAMTPAERFEVMDRLCREITWLAANAKRIR